MNGTAWQLALRNARKHRRQSLAALLTLATAFVSLALFAGYMHEVEAIYFDNFSHRQMLGDVIVQSRSGEPMSLPQQAWLSDFAAGNGVETAARFVRLSGLIAAGDKHGLFSGWGYDVAMGEALRAPTWRWNVIAGEPLREGDASAVVLGRDLAALLGCHSRVEEPAFAGEGGYPEASRPFVCESAGLSLEVFRGWAGTGRAPVTLVGITNGAVKAIDEHLVYLPLASAQALLDTTTITFEAMRLRSAIVPFIEKLNREAAGMGIVAERWQDHPFGDLFVRSMDFLSVVRWFVLILLLVIVVVSAHTTFARTAQQRTRELATLRSLGFQTRALLGSFALESGLVAGVAALVGCACTCMLTLIINRLPIRYKAGIFSESVPLLVAPVPLVYASIALFLILTTAIVAGIAARSRLRMPIVEALTAV